MTTRSTIPIHFEPITQIPFPGFERLIIQAGQEGHIFIERLRQEWASHENRFDKPGEALYAIFHRETVIGIGGINRSPFAATTDNPGRLRRFYILPEWRRRGVGAKFVRFIVEKARHEFKLLELRTHREEAQHFYEQQGFERIYENEFVTHRMVLHP